MNIDSLQEDALFYDYSSAANPIIQGLIRPVPFQSFSPSFFDSGPTCIMPLDVSKMLGCEGPATSPALCANFIRIITGYVQTTAAASSHLFYIHRGAGRTDACGATFFWEKGDVFVLPSHEQALHHCDQEAAIYWVHDAPLLRYLGVSPVMSRFKPTLYKRSQSEEKLRDIVSDAKKASANRISVLLANSNFPQTRTISHTLWAMYGLLPAGKSQLPHRHESVALDFVVDCKPGVYTLIGTQLDESGWIKSPHREDWSPGASFITPPGYWHSHHNESGADAHVLPIQDAGLQEYLRTLEIKFSHVEPNGDVHVTDVP
jgi:gentisate 1,2-dioxygenase